MGIKLKKGIKLNKNQNSNRMGNGESRFDFYFKYKKIPNEKTLTCKASVVNSVFDDWVRGLKQYIDDEEKRLDDLEKLKAEEAERADLPRLFQNMDEYLLVLETKRTPKMMKYTQTVFRYFKECFGDMVLSEFKRSYVQDYIYMRRGQNTQRSGKRLSDRTINREIADLSTFFTWCIEREIYPKVNPCFKQKLKVDIRRFIYLNSEQREELIDAAKAESSSIHAAVVIALSTGFRPGEVYNIEWRDVDFQNSRIFLRASTTKNKESGIISIQDYLVEFLEKRREKALDKQGRVFQEWPTIEWMENAFVRVRKKLSFNPLPDGTNLTFKDLRHVYAQMLRDEGILLQDIQAFCRHSSVSVTEKFYAQAGGKNAKEKVERLANVLPIDKCKVS